MSAAVETLEAPTSTEEALAQVAQAAASDTSRALPQGYYTGIWKKIWASSAFYWWAYRHYLDTGQVVVQLGTRRSPLRTGIIEIGLRRDFTAQHTGRHRFVFKVEAGPITSIQGAIPYAFGILGGRGTHAFHLRSGQTSYHAFNEDLVRGQPYSVYVVGGVKIYPTSTQRPYGEMIFTCPSIDVFPLPRAAEQDPLDERLSALLPGQGSLDEAAATLGREFPDEVLEIQDGNAELAEQMFSSFDSADEN